MKNSRPPRRAGAPTLAQIDALEARRMFNAATLKHGLLTVYGSDNADTITINSPSANVVTVTIDGTSTSFRGTGILRMRVFGYGGDDTITLGDTYTPNMTDVAIDAGDGNDVVTDASLGHRYNRAERVSVAGGAGDDTLAGGAHTFLLDGGAGDDNLSGGAAGAVLNGGDGVDIVSAADIGTISSPAVGLFHALVHDGTASVAAGGVVLNGGAGDDVIIGNCLNIANVSDTLSGGDGNDQFFSFGTDQIVDMGVGLDTQPANDQFVGNADVTQTATLSIVIVGGSTSDARLPTLGVGNNGPQSSIFVSDANGTLTMQGPMGSNFLLGDLFNAAGYPVDLLGIPTNSALIVNGFPAVLTGNQIAGYQINPGDSLELDLNFS